MIKLSEILNEVLLGEKRAVSGVMNPNENLGALLDMLYKKHGFDKVYVSFRDSKHVGKINPNNQHGTPTGLYTYKLSSYIKTPIDNLDYFRGAFPWATDRQYAQFLVVKDNIVQLNSSTSKGVLDGYVKKIMGMYPNIDPIQGLCESWLDGSYESYYGESNQINIKNDTHKFWLFLYDVSAYLGGSKNNIFSSLCRKLGIDSFDDDKCEGWIHNNEKCQTVFLRSNLFKDEYVLDLGKIRSKSSVVDMRGSSEDKLKWLLGLSRDKVIELISRNVLDDLIIELSSHIDVIMAKLGREVLESMISNMTYSGINRLLSNSKNIGQLSELVLKAKGKNLETQTIRELLFLNDYNFELTKRILDLKGDNITNDNITVILNYNPYAFKVSELLIDILGPKLNGDGIYSILMHSKGLVSSDEFNGLIKKLIIKTKETLNNDGIVHILYHSRDPYELIDLLNEIYEGDVVSEALNQMNYSYYLQSMIHNKSNPDQFITYLIKTVPNKLDTSELKILFDNTKDSQKLITELLSTKEFIKSVVDSDNIFVVIDLMNRSDNPNLVKSAFGSFGDEVISRFKSSGYLSLLFDKCKNGDALVDILLDSEQFLSNMASDNQFMQESLPYFMKSSDKDATIYKLLSLKGTIEVLTPMLISDILSDSYKPYELFKLILSKGYTFKEWYGDFTYFALDRLSKVDRKNVDNMINTLMSIDKVRESVGINDLYYMLSYSNNPELVKSLFGDKFSELVKNLSESRVLIMLTKSPDPEKLVEIYNEVRDIKYVLEDASMSEIEDMLIDPTNKPAIKRILDKYGIDYPKNESVKSMLRDKLISESFDFGSMTDEEQSKVYDVFKKSYEKSTGVSWDINKFKSRASNWVFFGDESGYVAVRPQASGLYKLVGVAGSPKGILSGLNELLATGRPIWGMVSNDIQGMAVKKGFKTPPPMVMRVLLKFIPKSVFGGVDFELNNDGSITMKYSDVGDAKKYFIANDAYFKKLKSDILPTMKDKLAELPMVVRKGIDMFLGEGELNESDLLNEDITSGRVIVYHRTGKGGESPVANIAADGYRVGGGARYGVGVYTTYTLDSQLSGKMSGYGNIIIESKVLSMDKFLIFDYDVAKKIYGNKNYTLDKQLRLILGGEWDKYKNDPKLKGLGSKVGLTKYTSDIAYYLTTTFTNNIMPKLRGIVFTGQQDGNVLVSYDRTNVEPLRYSTDEGVSWTNIVDKNIYKRIKSYNPDDSNISHQHLINKFDTGLANDSDYKQILKQPEIINKLNSVNVYHLLDKSSDKDKVINVLLNNDTLISNLDSIDIYHLLEYSRNKDKIINLLLNNKALISRLDSYGIDYLLQDSSDKDKVINVLLNNDTLISKLDLDGMVHLLYESSDKDKVINDLLNNDTLINNLDRWGIMYLLGYSSEPEKLIISLTDKYSELGTPNKVNKFIGDLDSAGIGDLLQDSSNKDKLIKVLLNNDTFSSKLDSNIMYDLLNRSIDKDEIINVLLNNDTLINNLDRFGIMNLLNNSSDKDKVINVLLNNATLISNLDLWITYKLLDASSNPENIMKRLGDKGRELINKLDSDEIISVLEYSSNPKKVINVFGDKGRELINKLEPSDILKLLSKSNTPEKVMEALGDKGTDVISNLDPLVGVIGLLDKSRNEDKVINLLLNNDTLISKFESPIISYLLYSSSDKDKVINVLLKNKNLMSRLDSDGIRPLLKFSSEPEEVMNRLDDKGRELISKLHSDGINYLLKNAKNKEAIKRIFDKYEIDYPKNESVKSLLRKKMIYL